MPVLVDFKHEIIDGRRKYKKDSQGKKIPCSPSNIERLAKKHSNSKALCKAALKRWKQGTTQHRYMRQALYGFLRYCEEEQNFELTKKPPAVI